MFDEDLDIFFDDFGVAASINMSPPRSITVIRSTQTETVQMYDGAIEAGADFVLCKSADVVGVNSNHSLTVDGKTYRILFNRDRGTGTSELHLRR